MAAIINFNSASKKVLDAKNGSNALAPKLTSVSPRESITPSNSVQPCRALLRSLNKFTDLLDKQIADLNNN